MNIQTKVNGNAAWLGRLTAVADPINETGVVEYDPIGEPGVFRYQSPLNKNMLTLFTFKETRYTRTINVIAVLPCSYYAACSDREARSQIYNFFSKRGKK